MRKKLSFAIRIPESAADNIRDISLLLKKNNQLKLIKTEYFYSNLVYLGAISPNAQKAAEEAALISLKDISPFEVKIGSVDYFFKQDKTQGSLIFLNLEDKNRELKNLHKVLSLSLREKDFSPAEHFRPYVVLGLLKRQRFEHDQKRQLEELTQIDQPSIDKITVEKIDLIEVLNKDFLNPKILTVKTFLLASGAQATEEGL